MLQINEISSEALNNNKYSLILEFFKFFKKALNLRLDMRASFFPYFLQSQYRVKDPSISLEIFRKLQPKLNLMLSTLLYLFQFLCNTMLGSV